MVSARSPNSWPSTSFRNNTGTNTATVVAVEASSAPATWRAPVLVASSSGVAPSRRRTTLPQTTIAPSTTMPTANASPASEMTFRLRPQRSSTTKVAHRAALAPREHQRSELLGREASGEAQRILAPADVELAAGHVGRARGAAGHVRDTDAKSRGARQVERDAHVVGRPRVHLDGRDSRNRFEPRAYGALDEAPLRLDRT